MMLRVFTLVLLLACPTLAHPTLRTMVFIEVSRDEAGGVVEVRVLHDVLAYALNDTSATVLDWQMYELLEASPEAFASALQDSRERFEGGFWVLADGERLDFELVECPTPESVDQWRLENPQLRLPIAMYFTLRARLPQDATELAVRGPYVMDEMMLVVRRPCEEETYLTAEAAEPSESFGIAMATEPVLLQVTAKPPADQGVRADGGQLGLGVAPAVTVISACVFCSLLVRPRRANRTGLG